MTNELAITLLVILISTSFCKFFTVLSILRIGLSLHGVGFSLVTLALSLVLTLTISPAPGTGTISELFKKDPTALEASWMPYIQKNLDPALKETITQKVLTQKGGASGTLSVAEQRSIDQLTFLAGELRSALSLGLLFILPFLLIDLVIAHLVHGLGLQGLSHAVLSLPLKIALFLSVDGVRLVIEKLLGGS